MNNAGLWINETIGTIQNFLKSINYNQYFLFGIIILICICCVVRFLRLVLILLSPNGYSSGHSGVMGKIAHISFWFSILFEVLVWFLGGNNDLMTLCLMDKMAAIFHFALMALSLLLAGINMLFKRGGKRVPIAQSLCRSSIVLALEGLFLFLLSFFMIP